MTSVHKCVVSLNVHSMYVCTVYAHTGTHVISMHAYNVHAYYVYAVVVCGVCACTYECVSVCTCVLLMLICHVGLCVCAHTCACLGMFVVCDQILNASFQMPLTGDPVRSGYRVSFLGFGKRVSCSPGWPQILCIAKDDLVLPVLLLSPPKCWVTDPCHCTPFWVQFFSLVDFRVLGH